MVDSKDDISKVGDDFDQPTAEKASVLPSVSASSSAAPQSKSKTTVPNTKIPMPALSPTMTSGNIVSYRKKIGDKVKPGDVLAEIQTDKATLDFECQDEGYVAKIMVPAGTQDVPVGKVCEISSSLS